MQKWFYQPRPINRPKRYTRNEKICFALLAIFTGMFWGRIIHGMIMQLLGVKGGM